MLFILPTDDATTTTTICFRLLVLHIRNRLYGYNLYLLLRLHVPIEKWRLACCPTLHTYPFTILPTKQYHGNSMYSSCYSQPLHLVCIPWSAVWRVAEYMTAMHTIWTPFRCAIEEPALCKASPTNTYVGCIGNLPIPSHSLTKHFT